MKKLFEKHVFLRVFAAIAMALILLYFVKFLVVGLGHVRFESNLGYFIREVLQKVLPTILTAGVFGTLYVLKNFKEGLGKSFLSGGWIVFLSLFGSFFVLSTNFENGARLKSIPELIFYVLFLLMVGLSEELLFRGTVEQILLSRFGDKGRGMVLSVVISALLFGLYHLPNYFSGQGFRSTLMQMVGTAMMGMLFGAIYAKRKNLYGVAILHAMIDFFTLGDIGLFQGASMASVHTTANQSTWFWTLVSNGTFVIVAIIVMLPKKKKIRKEDQK